MLVFYLGPIFQKKKKEKKFLLSLRYNFKVNSAVTGIYYDGKNMPNNICYKDIYIYTSFCIPTILCTQTYKKIHGIYLLLKPFFLALVLLKNCCHHNIPIYCTGSFFLGFTRQKTYTCTNVQQ